MTSIPVPSMRQREVHLRDYWKIVWQGRWTVAAVFLVVLAATTAYTFLATPVYRATSTVEVQPQARRIAPGQDVSGIGVAGYGWFAEEKYQNTQLEVIRSRTIAERAFAKLGLAADPRFAEAKDPVAAFQALIRAEPRRETGLVDISILGPDREEITRWVNAVADTYVDRNLEKAQYNARSAVDQIQKLMEPLKVGLEKAEQSRIDVLQEQQLYNPENQAQIVQQRLEKLNGERNNVQLEATRLRETLDKIADIQASKGDPSSIPELRDDKVLQNLNQDKVQVERQLESVRVTFRPGAPAYQEKVQELEKIQARIRDQVHVVVANLQNRFDLARRNLASLDGDIRKAEDESLALGVSTSKYRVVNADAETKAQLLQAITKTMNEVSLSADLLANNVQLLDHAIPPLVPIKPNKRLNLFLGAVFGLFLGVGTAFFLDYLDNTLRSPEDVEKFVNLTTLAVIPKFVAEERNSHAVKEAYQSLRTALIFSSKNRERKIVLITSTGPQEGKSSTVAQLARTLAGAGERVIVLDCDLRRPTQQVHLKLDRDRGITNFLAAPRGEEDWSPFVKSVGPANLHAMTCGPIPPNPAELFGGERFARLLRDLRAAYDWVLIDSPPAMSLSDATLLAALSDMVLLVVRHNKTDRDHVARTVQQLRTVNARLAGVILNHVDLDRAYKKDYYYQGYYYYGEGKGSGDGKRSKSGSEERVGTGAGA